MSPRAGVAAAVSLFSTADGARFAQALDAYEPAVRAVADSKTGPLASRLVKNDAWWREDLPGLAAAKPLSVGTLVRVAEWKLTRGPMRPLLNKIKSNSAQAVSEAWTRALEALAEDGGVAAVAALAAGLQGIGPATASAVLAARAPSECPFMSDEAIEGCGLPRKYDLKTYTEFARRLVAKADELGAGWNAELVGRALWAVAVAHALGVSKASLPFSSCPTGGERGNLRPTPNAKMTYSQRKRRRSEHS